MAKRRKNAKDWIAPAVITGAMVLSGAAIAIWLWRDKKKQLGGT